MFDIAGRMYLLRFASVDGVNICVGSVLDMIWFWVLGSIIFQAHKICLHSNMIFRKSDGFLEIWKCKSKNILKFEFLENCREDPTQERSITHTHTQLIPIQSE